MSHSVDWKPAESEVDAGQMYSLHSEVPYTEMGLKAALNRGPILIKPDFLAFRTMSSHDNSAQTMSGILRKWRNAMEISRA